MSLEVYSKEDYERVLSLMDKALSVSEQQQEVIEEMKAGLEKIYKAVQEVSFKVNLLILENEQQNQP